MINHIDSLRRWLINLKANTQPKTEWETLFIPVLSIFLLDSASKMFANVKDKATVMISEVFTVMKT